MPSPVPNGILVEWTHAITPAPKFEYGDKISLSCEKGLELVGENMLYCIGTNKWSGVLPTCKDIDECEDAKTCRDSGSKCVNSVGSFQCICKDGWKLVHGSVCKGLFAQNES